MSDCFLVRNDREVKHDTGVTCYIKKSLQVRIFAASPGLFSNALECIILELKCENWKTVLFTSMYRRLKSFLLNGFFNILSRLSFAYKNIIIGGGLNCNLTFSNFEATFLRKIVSSHALHIIHSDFTYHMAGSDSWLDVFIMDSLSKVVYDKSDAPFIAGHDLLGLVYQFDVPPDPARTILRRTYRGFDEHAFRSELEVDCREALDCKVATSSNVVVIPDMLSSVIVSALDRHAPLRRFGMHRPRHPWLTDALKQRIKHCNSLCREAKHSVGVLAMAIHRQCMDELWL